MANNNDKKVLNVPALRFPEFTEEWQGEQLHEIAELSKGIGISKEQLSENGTPCILYGELYTKYKSEIISKIISKTDIVLKTVDIRSPKTGISVHFSYSLPMAMQIY